MTPIRLLLAVVLPSLSAFGPGCAVSEPRLPAEARQLPHAVLLRDGKGRKRHLHIAPVVDGGKLASGFGLRRHPMGGGGVRHEGIDISAPEGAAVRAAAGGYVVEMGWRGSYGRFIRIRHSDRLETAYAHLRRFARGLGVGRRVKQDAVIGYVGTTGRSTRPHLHFEIRRRDRPVDPLDLPRAAGGR
ncbi:MAG: peptidoglycan DD-metalloendopeptidase family protein [Alphaproteobacteria bacterium]|nr:peptidoglycan DD-metalloendopeptidase family protein [Alphaproteobacteria bacterium]